MRVLIVGKKQRMHWPETVAKFLPTSCESKLFLYNQKTFLSLLHFGWLRKSKHVAYRAVEFERTIQKFKPQLILFVSAFFIPSEFYRVADNFKDIKKVGWVADAFGQNVKEKADILDILFCADTGYLEVARNFQCPSFYLPLCADETVFKPMNKKHTYPSFFVGDANDMRIKFLQALQVPSEIYGAHWPKEKLSQHHVHNKKLTYKEVNEFYNRTTAPINLHFSPNNINGLNFRVFEISAAGGLIITNDQADLKLCYQPDLECLIYHTPEELNSLITKIVSNPEDYTEIAVNGYRKTLSQHTYSKRLEQMFEKIEQVLKKV